LLLAGIVLVVNLLGRRWLTATQMSLLWGLVLVRLLLPIGPGSSLCLQNLLADNSGSTSRNPVREPATVEEWMSRPRAADTGTKVVVYPSALADSGAENSAKSESAVQGQPEIPWDVLVGYSFLVLWPCGAAFVVLATVFSNWRFSRQVSHAPICHDERVVELWKKSSNLASVRREIPIVVFGGVRQPTVMGALHPRLLLPADVLQLPDDQLQMIMLHELAHVRRCDVAVNWGLVLVRAVHWWNPVYWLAASRFCSLREQACDAFVIQRLSGQSNASYGDLLLTLAQRTTSSGFWRVRVPASMLSIFSSVFRRRAVTSRLRALPRASVVRSRWQKLAVGGAIVLLAYCGLTDAKPASPSDEKAPKEALFSSAFEQSETADETHAPANQPVDQTLITRDYNLHVALATIAGKTLTPDEARKDFDAMLLWEFKQRPAMIAENRLKSSINPHQQSQGEGNSVPLPAEPLEHYEIDGERLHLSSTLHHHEEFARQLRAWEQGGLTQIAVECRFIMPGLTTKSSLNIPWKYVAPLSPGDEEIPLTASPTEQSTFNATARVEQFVPVVYAVLDPEKTKTLLNEAQMSTRTNILQAPKATCFNGQSATVADLSQRPFVTGIREQSPGVLAPKISMASEGTTIQWRSVVSADRKSIQLNSRIKLCGIEDVQTARVKTSIAHAEAAEVQVPHVKRCTIDLNCEIPDGHSMLIATLPERREQNVMYLLLTPAIVAEEIR
jgi:bla regulator protein blaR1